MTNVYNLYGVSDVLMTVVHVTYKPVTLSFVNSFEVTNFYVLLSQGCSSSVSLETKPFIHQL